jgi:predicted dehydrogenase
MGQGYAADPVMANYYPYASHAQVLAAHPAFDWTSVIDPDPAARAAAQVDWGVANALTPDATAGLADVEVAVIATPPDARLDLIAAMPALRAVLVEKPLGISLAASRAFLDVCAARGVAVQVNLWRRADEGFRALADGRLAELVGTPRAVSAVYGNGLLNNGTHLVDLARMLFGEVAAVQRIGVALPFVEGPIPGDDNRAFALAMGAGPTVACQPVRFAAYRENGLSIWGERGRLDILNEGLTWQVFPVAENRAMQGEREIVHDAPKPLASTVGVALYRMYDNLAAVLAGTAAPWSDGESALRTSLVVDAIAAAPADGRLVPVD